MTENQAAGKTDVTILSEGMNFDRKADGFDEERTEPVPVVLWGQTSPSAVLSFYYKTQQKDAVETIRFSKHSLDGKEKRFSERLAAVTDNYPITYKVKIGAFMDKEKLRAKSLVKMESILTADINGDGVEEMIVPKTHGDIDVYDTKTRLFSSRPWDAFLEPKAYDLHQVSTHMASLENRDVVFYAFNRSVAGGISGLPEKERQKARQTDIAAIFQIDHKGIRQIVPYGPDINWILANVWGIGAINYPGSKDIDEIVILHELASDTSGEVYVTRLKPDGQVIDKPRKFYPSYSEDGNTSFIFVPQSKQIIMEGAEGYYFITPEKPVNWARRVNQPDDYAGILRGDKGLVVLVRDNMDLFAFDEEGRFYTRDIYGKPQISAAKKPFYTFRPESDRHKLEGIYISKHTVDKPQYLLAQYREMQTGDILPWEKKLEIAKKYMKDDVREERLRELKQKAYDYHHVYQGIAEREYKTKYGKFIKLPTLGDVKEHFPEHYAVLQAEFEQQYRELIWSRLLTNADPVNEKYYRDYDGYRRYFESRKVPDDREMFYTFISDFKETKKIKLPDYQWRKDNFDPTNLRLPKTTFRFSGNTLTIVTWTLLKAGEATKIPVWLLIRQEGGRI